jgi:phage-related minor tail protein
MTFDEPARSVRVAADFSRVTRALDDVNERISGLSKPAQESAELLERAFTRSFDVVEAQILRAAKTGQFSFRGMVDAIIADLSRMAVQTFITQPLEGFFKGLFNFGGARAVGGPVTPGRSYLVGENGPELFTPSGHGSIAPNGQGGTRPQVSITVHARDAESFRRSESQLTAMLSRAVMRGQRSL